MSHPRYLIAEDEPLLATALLNALQQHWPAADCAGMARDGQEAIAQIEETRPDVVFLDVRMPVMDGLEVARQLAQNDQWPFVVFVTAYEEYAIRAFDSAAVDYLLKPVEATRLQQCVARLERQLAAPLPDPAALLRTLSNLLQAGNPPATQLPPRLRHVRAGVGQAVKLIPVEDILWFEVAEKYLVVATAEGDKLIRMPLRDLIEQLDPDQFWQVHRGTVVNVRFIHTAERDNQGRVHLSMQGRPEKISVSRQFAHLFRQM